MFDFREILNLGVQTRGGSNTFFINGSGFAESPRIRSPPCTLT